MSRFVDVFLTKRSRWLAAVPVAIFGIVFAMPASIFAATATSPEYIMGPILSHNYVAYSEVDTPGSDDVYGLGEIYTEYGESVPVGYMADQVGIYNFTTGNLRATSQVVTNSSATTGLSVEVELPSASPTDAFYASAYLGAYNGSGYDTVEANTPSVDNAPQVQSSAEPTFPTNANGQTYGSSMGLPPSESPVLVAVQDTAGQTGYVYARQLYGGWYGQVPTTPQQAVALNSSGPDTIPVYESNGTTVIGQFVVGQNVTVSLAATPAPTGMTEVHVF